MESTEIKVARMEEKLDGVSDSIREIKEALKEHVKDEADRFTEMQNSLDSRDRKYATKDMLKWTGAVIMSVLTIVFTVIQLVA